MDGWNQRSKSAARRRKKARRRKNGTGRGKTWCRVYAIRDHVGRTVYIGQTRLKIEGRMRWHRKNKDTRICQWMRAENEAGRPFSVVVLDENATWDVSEIILIERARAAGEPLLNQTRGGKDPYRHKTLQTLDLIWDDNADWP